MDDTTPDPVRMDICQSAISQQPSADDKENPVKQEEAFMGPEPNPAHASAPASSPTANAGVTQSSISSDKDFSFTYVLEDYLRIESLKVYSPYHSFGGFKWRLLIFPRGNHTSHDLSVYLECGGPVQPEPSDKRSAGDGSTRDHSVGRHGAVSALSSYSWSRPARFWLHLVHPSRRASVGLPEKGPVSSDHDNFLNSKDNIEDIRTANSRISYDANQITGMEVAHNRDTSTRDIIKDTAHVFKEKESDWGFLEFAHFNLLRPGRYADEDRNVIIRVRIRLEDSFDAMLHNNVTYDSRKETGYVGFKNQGATCYMNSLLQTLYMLGDFRRAVFDMPLPDPENENSGSEMSYALQKVFYELQHSPTVVKTKKLTESFGWDTTDAFTQHDIQELNRILCDHLEEKMKKIAPEQPNKISRLFQGTLLNYIECINVDCKSTKEEAFYDLSLNVKGCRNILESFEKYTEVEMMDGENKYSAEGIDELQEARKGVKFLKLPPVLQLHLKRFEYDFTRDAMVKINDRYEFSTEVDLSPYVHESDGSDVYLLHSVLVHIGDVNGGHYHAFIRPMLGNSDEERRSKWFKFDDETVTPASEKDAVSDNFGFGGERDPALITANNALKRGKLDMDDDFNTLNGGQTHPPTMMPRTRNYQSRRFTNAYMLQYIRKSQASNVLKPCTKEDVPKELAKRIEQEREEEERRKKERAEQHLYTYMAIATDANMYEHCGSDLVDWEKVRQIRVIRALQLRELKQQLQAEGFVTDAHRIRLWRCVLRQNDTIRPDTLLADGDDSLPISDTEPHVRIRHNSYNVPVYNSTRYGHYGEDILRVYVEDFTSPYAYRSGRRYCQYVEAQRKEAERISKAMAASNSEKEKKSSSDDASMDAEKGDSESALSPRSKEQRSVLSPSTLATNFPLYSSEVLLFFKFYTPTPSPCLRWLGHAVVDKTIQVKQLEPLLRKMVQDNHESLPGDLAVYEELSASRVSLLNGSRSLEEQRIPYDSGRGGDIIVFQSPPPPAYALKEYGRFDREIIYDPVTKMEWDYIQDPCHDDEKDLPLGGRPMPAASNYYNYLSFRIKVEFKSKWSYSDVEETVGIVLELLRTDTYLTVRKILANAIGDGAHPDYLRLFVHDFHRVGPAHEPVRLGDHEELLKNSPMHTVALSPSEYRILWYERTEYRLSEFQHKDEVRVIWRGDGGVKSTSESSAMRAETNGLPSSGERTESSVSPAMSTEDAMVAVNAKSPPTPQSNASSVWTSAIESVASFSVLVPQMSKYYNVIDEIRRRQHLDAGEAIRLMEVKGNRISRFIDPAESVPRVPMSSFDYGVELRAEPIPPDEKPEVMKDEYELVAVVHMAKEKPRAWRGPSFFGVPFVIRVRSVGQSVKEIRKCIREKLDVPADVFQNWRLAEVLHHKVEFLDDLSIIWAPGSRSVHHECASLAIEHRSPTPTKRANTSFGRFADKPLKIRS